MNKNLLILLLILFTLSIRLFSASFTWDGDASNDWNTDNNWVGNPVFPNAADADITFSDIAGSNLSPNISSSVSIRDLTFNAATDVFTLSGSAGQTLNLSSGSDIIQSGAANATISANIDTGGNAFGFGGSGAGTLTASGIISGAGDFIKTGTGTLIFSGANTYSGTTTVSTGKLQVENVDALGDSGVATSTTVSSGAGLVFNISGSNTLNNENFTISGSGVSSSGALDIDVGNLTLSGTVNMAADSSIDVNTGAASSFTGIISGSAALTKTGDGILVLTGDNSYTGATNISDGQLWLNHENGLGRTAGTTTTTVSSGADLRLNITGGGTISNENLSIEGYGASSNGAIYNTTGDNTISGTVTFTNGAGIGVASGTTLTLNGIVGATGGFQLLKQDTGTLVFGATNTFTGQTKVTAGKIIYATDDGSSQISLGATSGSLTAEISINTDAVIVDGNISVDTGSSGTKTISTDLATGQTGYYNGSITLNDNVTFSTNDNSTTYVGNTGNAISGTGAMTVSNNTSGTLVLAGPNTYSGGTTLNNGIILLNNSSGSATGTGALTVSAGTTVGGTGSTSSTFTLGSGITLSPGATGSGSVGELNFTGSPSGNWVADNSTYVWNLSDGGTDGSTLDGVAGTAWDVISFSNTLTLDTSSLASNPMTIQIRNQDGSYVAVQGFNQWVDTPNYSGTGYDFKIMDNVAFSSGSFDESYFNLDSDILNVSWRIAYDSGTKSLFLSYASTPEPGTWIMISGIIIAVGFRFRKKIRQHFSTVIA